MRRIAAATGLLLAWLTETAVAESYGSIRERRPDLFHPESGYRIARHRAPVPDDIPMPVRRVSALWARTLLDRGALALDVFGASQSRFDELDGTWLVSEPRMSLPGAVWLPEVGRGVLEPVIERYLQRELERATVGKKAHAVVVFCVADCWMSWNAAQRIAALGYLQVHWYPHGTDGWADLGWRLEPVEPVPVWLD
ncbi:PQQ-dependent catabolism-associated CXXCW motif protein [Ruegeria sp. PrR005]|uniref:PQQ-dependent catabolism-associated CXXCW motif protein n=1 Tax=Ruegeria sp. PrR005 TaxID=2706882 RepID=A0A6B2NK19_9RHOB|nr:PQQ-dependent catabolism-associated CXXCW motif protein [Ruegeria sp. PrR005]NDW43530.1 PQQ-dependent catabolism-associated CXXCW motif protein [Ruegeria sp. PrR005]